jgi:hypothetical protein
MATLAIISIADYALFYWARGLKGYADMVAQAAATALVVDGQRSGAVTVRTMRCLSSALILGYQKSVG